MSQFLILSCYRQLSHAYTVSNRVSRGLATEFYVCRTCQKLQQLLSRTAVQRGVPAVRCRSTNAREAQLFRSWKKYRNEEQQAKQQLVKVLEARAGQLQNAEKSQASIPSAVPSSGLRSQQQATWKESLACFQAQMESHRTAPTKPEAENKTRPGVTTDKEYSRDYNVAEKANETSQKKKSSQPSATSTGHETTRAAAGKKTKKSKKKISGSKVKKTSGASGELSASSAPRVSEYWDESVGETNRTGQYAMLPQGGALISVDFSGEIDGEHESEADIVTEIERVLREKNTQDDVALKLQGYLNKLISEQKSRHGETTATFWKPEDLKDMNQIKQGLEVIEKLMHKMGQLRQSAVERELARQTTSRNLQHAAELKAYIEACLHTDKVRRAHSALVIRETNRKSRYRSKTDTHQHMVTDPDIYNKVMSAWAKQAKLEPIRRLFSQMKETKVAPNLQSFAACLECLGRQSPLPINTISRVITDIGVTGHDVKDLLNDCIFQDDQWIHVLKAVKAVLPEYSPNPPPVQDQYACSLLADLNGNQIHKASSGNQRQTRLSLEMLQEQANRQLDCEQQDFITVPTILPQNPANPQVIGARKKLEASKQRWRHSLRKAFLRDLAAEESKQKGSAALSIVPYLKLFPPETYVNLMMQEVDTLALETESYSPSISLLQRHFGHRVYHHYLLKNRIKTNYVFKVLKVYNEYLRYYATSDWSHGNHRQCWQSLLAQHSDSSQWDSPPQSWTPHLAKMVGKWLYKIILMDTKIDANILKKTKEMSEIPAFYTVYRQVGPQVHEVIKPHPLMVRLYWSANIAELTFDSRVMPSLSPPLPWHGVDSGGNLLSTTNLIVNAGRSKEQLDVLRKLPANQLNPVFDAINALSATPWSINQPILDLIIDVFNNGGNANLDVPKPSSSCPDPPKILPTMTDVEKIAVLRERQRIKKIQQEMHSLWMTELYRLSIANMFRDKVFWFPHNLDFRSRTYATPPHFNHLGSDLARSLLQFAEGIPLGPDGLSWLKIHLVNLTGFKKRSSNRERLEYANEMMSDILDSADNPMSGNRWWQTSDEPWQTLACCIEVAKASRSPDPAQYVCHFPVHQDGSCNGLQHYAALGRDKSGAESVNLCPFTRPKDVYSDVVELVEKERQKDAAKGNEIAIALEGFIRRKVIKQTIMTTVYGVTRYGARLQIERQLEAIEEFPPRMIFESSLYLTHKTFTCLLQMFTSTKEIQDWLTVCAKIISSVFYRPVEWTTPVGWPVIQPYYRPYNPSGPSTGLNAIEIPSTRRQKNGFAPNFIHSLDSTHMMLTAIHCHLAGLTFVSVHDCFWTHPSTVNLMNKICRDQFVALHSQPILENLAHLMHTKFGFHPGGEDYHLVDPITRDFINHVLSRVPERGTFNLDDVKESTYFFS